MADGQDPFPLALCCSGVARRFGARSVPSGITFRLARGEILALLGPSGCGKTTLLRLVAGLLPPSGGEIAIAGRTVAAAGIHLPPEARGLGMVFEEYALGPPLSMAENVGFPLEMRGVPRPERDRRVPRPWYAWGWPPLPPARRARYRAASSRGWRWRVL